MFGELRAALVAQIEALDQAEAALARVRALFGFQSLPSDHDSRAAPETATEARAGAIGRCRIGFIESASIDCAFDGSFWQKATGSIQLESNGVRSKTSGINTVANVECTLDIDGVVYEVQQGTMLQAPLSPD
jgi:hypothetical protein